MASIGAGWVDGAWVQASWVTGAWQQGADVTAPILSLPTGIKTGSTTGSGTVSTDEGNGTLYYWASTSASETAADIVTNGSSQAVSGTGVQAVTFSGLTTETAYYAHYVHDDSSANRSNVVSSTPAFTTDAAASSEPTTGNEGGARGGYQRQKKRKLKAAILAEDQEFIKMANQALPELIKRILN